MTNTHQHTIPIAQRTAPKTWTRTLQAILFFIIFNLGCIFINGSQFIFLLPLRVLPFRWSRKLYYAGIRYTKGSFGCLQILMCQWFAPTQLVITFEREGLGKFTAEEVEQYIQRNEQGQVVSLNLPTKFVLIGNHQIYADWWYAWCFTYFTSPRGVHKDVYITLKNSLRWLPIVGWGMQFFNFIFLARSWASDRLQLASSLTSLAKAAESEHRPFVFLLYPEGTLVSKGTRPISKKFADKIGVDDLKHVLLPRSTGLHFSLRSLSPRIKNLQLLDLTVTYPGVPPMGYGQDYYTLRSIFFDGLPPPAIHMHLRMFNVRDDIPIGDLSSLSGPQVKKGGAVEVEIPVAEKDVFDTWLRKLWKEKDDSIDNYHTTGHFSKDGERPIEIPLRLRRNSEILDAFCFFWPAALVYCFKSLRG